MKPLYPVTVMLDRLVAGKRPKEIAYELGVTVRCIDYQLQRHVEREGYRSLFEAVAIHARSLATTKPPDAVD